MQELPIPTSVQERQHLDLAAVCIISNKPKANPSKTQLQVSCLSYGCVHFSQPQAMEIFIIYLQFLHSQIHLHRNTLPQLHSPYHNHPSRSTPMTFQVHAHPVFCIFQEHNSLNSKETVFSQTHMPMCISYGKVPLVNTVLKSITSFKNPLSKTSLEGLCLGELDFLTCYIEYIQVVPFPFHSYAPCVDLQLHFGKLLRHC